MGFGQGPPGSRHGANVPSLGPVTQVETIFSLTERRLQTLRLLVHSRHPETHRRQRERWVESPWSPERHREWDWLSLGNWPRAATVSACSTCRAPQRFGPPRSYARAELPPSPWKPTSPIAEPSTLPSTRCARSSD